MNILKTQVGLSTKYTDQDHDGLLLVSVHQRADNRLGLIRPRFSPMPVDTTEWGIWDNENGCWAPGGGSISFPSLVHATNAAALLNALARS